MVLVDARRLQKRFFHDMGLDDLFGEDENLFELDDVRHTTLPIPHNPQVQLQTPMAMQRRQAMDTGASNKRHAPRPAVTERSSDRMRLPDPLDPGTVQSNMAVTDGMAEGGGALHAEEDRKSDEGAGTVEEAVGDGATISTFSMVTPSARASSGQAFVNVGSPGGETGVAVTPTIDALAQGGNTMPDPMSDTPAVDAVVGAPSEPEATLPGFNGTGQPIGGVRGDGSGVSVVTIVAPVVAVLAVVGVALYYRRRRGRFYLPTKPTHRTWTKTTSSPTNPSTRIDILSRAPDLSLNDGRNAHGEAIGNGGATLPLDHQIRHSVVSSHSLGAHSSNYVTEQCDTKVLMHSDVRSIRLDSVLSEFPGDDRVLPCRKESLDSIIGDKESDNMPTLRQTDADTELRCPARSVPSQPQLRRTPVRLTPIELKTAYSMSSNVFDQTIVASDCLDEIAPLNVDPMPPTKHTQQTAVADTRVFCETGAFNDEQETMVASLSSMEDAETIAVDSHRGASPPPEQATQLGYIKSMAISIDGRDDA